MKTRIALLVVAALLPGVFGGCSGIDIWTEQDPTASFQGLHTYGWASVSQSIQNDLHAENPILDRRIRLIVDDALAARGFKKQQGGTPDFLIGYHVAVKQQLDVRYVNDYYGYAYTSLAWRPQRTVYAYDQGTLILDVSLPDPKRLIWRGVATAEVFPGESQAKGDKRIAEAVDKMLDKFPPAEKPPAAGATKGGGSG
jgi:hypothetical protein